MLLRPNGMDGNQQERPVYPGDVLAGGENALSGALTTVGAGTWTGAMIATGIMKRTGPTGAFTDTTDTAANIIAALAGNAPNVNMVPGTTFRFLFRNAVAFAHTFAAGSGVVAGDGTLNSAASAWHEYLITILSACANQIINCATTNGSPTVTFNLNTNQSAKDLLGSNGSGISNLIGATVSGTGISTGTTVIGITMGQGGATGVTLSANATATTNPVALTFGPTVQFDSLRAGIVI